MTRLSTLSLDQVYQLEFTSKVRGDRTTEHDCEVLLRAFANSSERELYEVIAASREPVVAAAERCVARINHAGGEW